jgi:hypothetical protein
MNKWMLLLFCFLAGRVGAQDKTGNFLYGGFGMVIPSAEMKEHSFFKNGISFRGGYSQSLFQLKPGLQLALEVKINYSKFAFDYKAPGSITGIRYYNGSSQPAALDLQLHALEKKPDAFEYLGGPAIVFTKKKLLLQGAVFFGYSSVSQEHFLFDDSIKLVTDPSQDKKIAFYSGGHQTNNGFVWEPALKAGWKPVKHLLLFAELSYSIGPEHYFTDEVFNPAGTPDASGVYGFAQLKNGTVSEMQRISKLRALAVSLNLGYIF